MTKEEFERGYAERSGCTLTGLTAVQCNCGDEGCHGWQMEYVPKVQWSATNDRWEYYVLDIPRDSCLREYLDAMGPLGWELVMQNDEQLYIFKRRVR